MSIEILQLRYAVATADAKSFSRAASALNVKQITLGRKVQQLEDRLGGLCRSKCTGWAKELTALSVRHAPLPKTSQSVPLFQLVTRGHPVSRDDVCEVPAQLTERRGSAIRAWDRHLPRHREVLVEPVRTDVCGRYPTPAGASDARDIETGTE